MLKIYALFEDFKEWFTDAFYNVYVKQNTIVMEYVKKRVCQ